MADRGRRGRDRGRQPAQRQCRGGLLRLRRLQRFGGADLRRAAGRDHAEGGYPRPRARASPRRLRARHPRAGVAVLGHARRRDPRVNVRRQLPAYPASVVRSSRPRAADPHAPADQSGTRRPAVAVRPTGRAQDDRLPAGGGGDAGHRLLAERLPVAVPDLPGPDAGEFPARLRRRRRRAGHDRRRRDRRDVQRHRTAPPGARRPARAGADPASLHRGGGPHLAAARRGADRSGPPPGGSAPRQRRRLGRDRGACRLGAGGRTGASRRRGGTRGGDRRQPGQVRLPRRREPRDPHAPEQHHRLHRPDAGQRRANGLAAPLHRDRAFVGNRPAHGRQRHPRLLQAGGGDHRTRNGAVRVAGALRGCRRHHRRRRDEQESRHPRHDGSGPARQGARRSLAPPAGAAQPAEQRRQVHRGGPRRTPRRARSGARMGGRASASASPTPGSGSTRRSRTACSSASARPTRP